MKQRIKIKQYKKDLNKYSNFVIESFKYDFCNCNNRTSIKIYKEYFQDLEALYKILKNKKLHIIKSLIKDENNKFVTTFADLLDCIDSMYEVAFDDKEIYNFSDLLR